MSRFLPLAPLAAAAAACLLAAPAPVRAAASRVPGAFGVVAGVDGVYAHAKVCVDRNGNARCDAREAAVRTRADGRFALKTSGPLVAEIGTDAFLVDPATGARRPVRRALVFRAPESGITGRRGVDPLSTEMQAAMDVDGAPLGVPYRDVYARLGVAPRSPAGDPREEPDPVVRAVLMAEQAALMDRIADAVAQAGRRGDRVAALADRLDLDPIRNVVVIYAENRSFANLYADFPGANGVVRASKAGAFAPQKDRDGSLLPMLPPVWGGLTAPGQAVAVTQAQTANVLPNAPFQVDAVAPAWGAPAVSRTTVTRDLYHRFFENQMQIDGGANDQFAAWGDSGGLVMGYFDGSGTAMWKIARQYVLADNFFQGAFGGSFLNHQYLVCACAPEYPDADASPAHPKIAALQRDAQGAWIPALALAPNSPPSALAGPPAFVLSGNIAPKDYFSDGTFRAVNTMQPPYQPSYVPPADEDATFRYANPLNATTLPAQTTSTIGDMLDTKRLSWTWYAGGWKDTLADRTRVYNDATGSFQSHHQPFNYYAALDPASHGAERAAHLRDYVDLVADAAAGKLPAVAFYKPVGVDNEHPGYANIARGDAHIAGLIATLKASPQWGRMLIVVTYDENGGQWDAVAPPKGDRLGPGTRVPALIVSPFARRGFVDHTPYDTGSVLRFITHRFSLPALAGLQARDAALAANGAPPMGDLTNALEFHRKGGRPR